MTEPKKRRNSLKNHLKGFITACILCIVISVVFNYSLEIHWKFIVSGFFILFLSRISKLSLWITTIIFCLISFIFPVTLNFGIPSKAHLLNVTHTNFYEAYEFITMVLSVKSVGMVLTALFLLALYLNTGLRFLEKNKDIQCSKYYKYTCFTLLCLLIFLSYKCYPPKLFADIYNHLKYTKHENSEFQKQIQTHTDIVITKNADKFKNVVVIIGESVTSDYLQVLGYPHNTTPKLQHMNGHFYKNFISAAPYTTHSLYRTLNYCPNKQDCQINNNLIHLANQAGFATYYFAAEPTDEMNIYYGSISKYNASNLPKSSEMGKFSLANPYHDDIPLLNWVRFALSDREKRRMIVLHMLGHHPRVCKRLRGYPNYFKHLKHKKIKGAEELNCYLSATRKLDDFIADIHAKLKSFDESYIIFYISDHGVVFDMNSNGGAFIHHGTDYKSNYRVPYIVISSEIQEHSVFSENISGYDWLSNVVDYLGIDTNIIRPKSLGEIAIKDSKDIVVYNGEKLVSYGFLKEDDIYL